MGDHRVLQSLPDLRALRALQKPRDPGLQVLQVLQVLQDPVLGQIDSDQREQRGEFRPVDHLQNETDCHAGCSSWACSEPAHRA